MAKKTTCKGIQDTIDWCQGTPELGGMRRSIYYVAAQDVVLAASLPRDAKHRPTSSILTGQYEFAEDVVAQRIDILPEKSRWQSDTQGEYPGQSQLDKLTLYHPSVSPEATAACCYINNSPCIFFFCDTTGRWRVCGDPDLPIKNSVTQDGGEGVTGSPNTTIAVESTNLVSFPYYTGKLKTGDGEIDCSIPGTSLAAPES